VILKEWFMSYVAPETVVSPKALWVLGEVIINTGDGGWSIAKGTWDGSEVLGIRWNGSSDDSGPGMPQARGFPTWYVLPGELETVVLREIDNIKKDVDAVSIEIGKGDDYDPGAWTIKAKLSEQMVKSIGNEKVIFTLPDLLNRFCRPDKNYSAVRGNVICGQFINGMWEGHLYSNGISEDKNPTDLGSFKETLTKYIKEAIARII